VETGLDPRLIGLGIALGIGLIVGLEREWADDKPVGLRSFALISILGGLCGLLVEDLGVWVVAAGLLGLALVLAAVARRAEVEGITTLLACLVVFLAGAGAVAGYWLHAIFVGGAVTVLLHWKRSLHGLVDRLGAEDFGIIARFVLISLVILPVLPNRTFGPYDVFNPFEAWLLVVLIVSINLAGYVAFRWVGARAGAWMAGVLGGLVSSTATALSYAGISRRQQGLGLTAAIVIGVASIVVYARIVLELSVVAPGLVAHIALPSAVFALVLGGLCLFMDRRQSQRESTEVPSRRNPAQVRQALAFGGLYVLILFAVAVVRTHFDDEALYGVAFISGLTDVDALTLSVGQMFANERVSAELGWRAIFLASLSNLLFKVTAAGLLGSPELRRWLWSTGSIALVAGVAIVVFWP
jgi:uncharacterized membrane protein (DUF4010 family)